MILFVAPVRLNVQGCRLCRSVTIMVIKNIILKTTLKPRTRCRPFNSSHLLLTCPGV